MANTCGLKVNILTTREAILASVTKRLERLQRERPLGFFTLDIPGDKPAYRALWGGSACFLRVPADREFKDKFIQDLRSKDVALRARAAHHLAKYPGRDTVELLKPLLQDPGTQLIQGVSSDKGKYEFTIYPVRQAAYKVLQTWGIDVPKPAGYREDYSGFFLD